MLTGWSERLALRSSDEEPPSFQLLAELIFSIMHCTQQELSYEKDGKELPWKTPTSVALEVLSFEKVISAS